MDFYRLLPDYWFQNYSTSQEWDEALNKLMDDNTPINFLNNYMVILGNTSIWIENWPHAYGTPVNRGRVVLPKVATRKRLRRYINQKVF